MSLRAFRVRLLLAMGIPVASVAASACQPPQQQLQPPQPQPAPAGDVPTFAPVLTAAMPIASGPYPARCEADHVRERICGSQPRQADGSSACHINGERITSPSQHEYALLRTAYASSPNGPMANLALPLNQQLPQLYATLGYDAAATARYRATFAPEDGDLSDRCCFSACTPLQVVDAPPPSPKLVAMHNAPSGHDLLTLEPVRAYVPPSEALELVCIAPPEGGTRLPAAQAPACPKGIVFSGAARPWVDWKPATTLGQNEPAGERCCYPLLRAIHVSPEHHRRGRPLRVDGVAHTAAVRSGRDWQLSDNAPTASGLTKSLRLQLRDAWLAEAQLEHASVAAFAQLTLQLVALAAPAQLVDDALAAGRDEVRHAQLAFSIAARFGGAHEPAAFAQAAAGAATDPLTLLHETLVDGCVGETVAAEEARQAAMHMRGDKHADALAELAADEQRHAELGWRIAAWVVRQHGDAARQKVLDVHDQLMRELRQPRASLGGDCCERVTAAYGILCPHERADVRREVLEQVVLPCLTALLTAADDGDETDAAGAPRLNC